jgi:hypothetical protein
MKMSKQQSITTNKNTPKCGANGYPFTYPASSDYQQPDADILMYFNARARGLDIIAFTDHNTVAGYRNYR